MIDIRADQVVADLQQFKATLLMINAAGIIASYPTALPFHFQSNYLTGDSLAEIIEACHAANIRVVARTEALGGLVSYKNNPDGTRSAYELNINYLDALARPGESISLNVEAQRFLASQAIMLALRGVPGVYFHSLFGSRSWRAPAVWPGPSVGAA